MLLKTQTKDYTETIIGFGTGKTLKLSEMDAEVLRDEIVEKYISVLERDETIGFVLEYWTADYHRKFTGFFEISDSGSVLLEALKSLQRRHGDWVLMFIEIRQMLPADVIKEMIVIVEKEKRRQPVKERGPRSILKYEYIRDFRRFLCIKGEAKPHVLKSKGYRDFIKSYSYKRDVARTQELALKWVGIYYLRSGFRLKVLDSSLIYKGSKTRRTRYLYTYSKDGYKAKRVLL
jgi:hypothetical protein